MDRWDGLDAGIGEHPFHLEDAPQQVGGCPQGKQVEGDAGNEFIRL